MVREIRYPLKQRDVEGLKVGDVIRFTGTLVTARDKAHQRLIELYKKGEKPPVDLRDGAIIHCGPIARREKDTWKIISAGPTTSYRMEEYTFDLIRQSGLRLIIGKGGMGEKTAEACKKYKVIYCAFTGGASVVAAEAIEKVENVFWLQELGMPEALWVFKVKDFGPLVVTIDAEGNNLTEEVIEKAKESFD
ncbi:MAG: fumarate hydratase C-terminal domain-containing protein [Thermoplasmata archaeon]|nr:MAG: fumarate hydratase [Thermoplasmata archaeon]MCD6468312.1 fumarate hydratase C-terminal domain-containing protein [Thermoplasmata archaeon]